MELAEQNNFKFDWDDPDPFVKAQQEQLFEWVQTAPDEPDLSGMRG